MLQFWNRNKAIFDWDIDNIEEDKDLIEDETRDNLHPSLQGKIPGSELEWYLEDVVRTIEPAPKS